MKSQTAPRTVCDYYLDGGQGRGVIASSCAPGCVYVALTLTLWAAALFVRLTSDGDWTFTLEENHLKEAILFSTPFILWSLEALHADLYMFGPVFCDSCKELLVRIIGIVTCSPDFAFVLKKKIKINAFADVTGQCFALCWSFQSSMTMSTETRGDMLEYSNFNWSPWQC